MAVFLTFSIESTVTVTCESSIFSAVKLPCCSLSMTSPNRARLVVSGM